MRAVSNSVFQASWYRFVTASKDSIWNAENAGASSAKVKYWRLLRTQQGLMRRLKTIRDPEGTDYRAITARTSANDEDQQAAALKRQQQVSRLRRTLVAQENSKDHNSESEDDQNSDEPLSRASTAAAMDDPNTSIQDEGTDGADSGAGKEGANKLLLSIACEVCHLMHCWSANLSIVGTQLTAVIDEINVSYNQVVAKDAAQYLQRPRNVSWSVNDVLEISPERRFRMQHTAIELLFRDHSSLLINFKTPDAHDSALSALFKALAPRRQTKAFPYVWQESPKKELSRRRVTERWKNREISNFDYLLELNYLAGRTVNDFTQYPVFPWVIADYTSAELNLNAPETFRDLRLPVGLCGLGNRREEVETRFSEMLQMGDEPFHYFTHYSSPAVVLYFMVRIEPFTCCQVLLQGGRFDHADRMFHSVASSWLGVTKNIQDVKEMIPELYYFPELCINNNNIRFGRKQDQTEMLDVVLPPWAKDDPYTFTYRMREALECDIVSSVLHHWIDLIFGYKQAGKAAILALNKFHPHTYEDPKVKLGSLDEAARKEIIDSLDNIGQTPSQLFTKKHPERKKDDILHPILSRAIGVKIVNASWAVERVAAIRVLRSDKLVVVGGFGAAFIFKLSSAPVMSKKEISTPTSATKIIDGIKNFRASTFSFDVSNDPEGRLPALPNGIIPNENRYENGPCSWKDVAILSYENDSIVYTVHGGYYDNSVYVRSFRNDDLRLTAHRGRVTCLAAAADSSYLVTGGRDTAFIVWSTSLVKGKLYVEISSTIYGHEEGPTACALSTDVDLVATASQDGVVLLHSLTTGRLEQCILHPQKKPVDFLLIQAGCYVPNILTCSKADNIIHQYSINGTHLRMYNVVGRLQHLSCVGDSQYLMVTSQQTSAQESTVQFLHSFFLSLVYKVSSAALPLLSVVACHPTNIQIMVAGGVAGSLVLLGTEASAGSGEDRERSQARIAFD